MVQLWAYLWGSVTVFVSDLEKGIWLGVELAIQLAMNLEIVSVIYSAELWDYQ
jgi:hypothetical protein